MLKEIITAIQAYFKAHLLIFSKNNYKWLLLWGFLYAILFAGGLFIFFKTSAIFTETLISKTNIKHWLQSNNTFLTYLFITSMIMFNWVLLLYYFCLFKYVYLLLCSPVFSYISLKTTALLDHSAGTVSKEQILALTKRSSITALKNLGWQTIYFIVFLVLSLLPVIGWIIPIIALITEFYFFGYATLEYKLHQNNLSSGMAQKYIQHHKGLAIGNGLVFYCILIVPVLGWIAAPIYSIIAANIAVKNFEKI